MLYLNLTDVHNSDFKFRISNFPDGQQDIRIEPNNFLIEDVRINSRFNSFRDLELIICANKALRNMGYQNIDLYIPYLLGGRSDRKFVEGGNNYLKDVVCPIINSQKFRSVSVMDPHSDVTEACLNNFVKISNIGLVNFSLGDIVGNDYSNVVLISPDAGAFKKIFDVAKKFDIQKVITATKVRDLKTGDILYTDVPDIEQYNDVKYVIVDDICDGGRTFTEVAKTIINVKPTAEIYLVVTHGIFSAGYEQLNRYFKKVYSTNSIKDIVDTTLVKQLNIF